MKTQERDRRIGAAEKRLAKAEEWTKRHRDRLDRAVRWAATERRDLDWLRQMPVDDEPPPTDDEDGAA